MNGEKASIHLGYRFCVLYIPNGEKTEKRTAWFSSRERAHQARTILAGRHGRAIVYCD